MFWDPLKHECVHVCVHVHACVLGIHRLLESEELEFAGDPKVLKRVESERRWLIQQLL